MDGWKKADGPTARFTLREGIAQALPMNRCSYVEYATYIQNVDKKNLYKQDLGHCIFPLYTKPDRHE